MTTKYEYIIRCAKGTTFDNTFFFFILPGLPPNKAPASFLFNFPFFNYAMKNTDAEETDTENEEE